MTATTDISVNESNEPSVLLPSSENNEVCLFQVPCLSILYEFQSASKPKKRGRKSKAELEELSRKFNRLTEDKNGNETSANGESQNKTKSGSSGPDPTTTIKKKRGRPKLKEGTQSPKTASEGNSAPVVEDSGDQTFSSVQNPLPHRRRGRPKANSLIPAIPVATSSENVRRRGRPKANLDQSEDLPSIKKRGRKRSAPVLTSQNNTKVLDKRHLFCITIIFRDVVVHRSVWI